MLILAVAVRWSQDPAGNDAQWGFRLVSRADPIEVAGVLLTAAWQFTKLADDNADGQRGARYSGILRGHADAVERGS